MRALNPDKDTPALCRVPSNTIRAVLPIINSSFLPRLCDVWESNWFLCSYYHLFADYREALQLTNLFFRLIFKSFLAYHSTVISKRWGSFNRPVWALETSAVKINYHPRCSTRSQYAWFLVRNTLIRYNRSRTNQSVVLCVCIKTMGKEYW